MVFEYIGISAGIIMLLSIPLTFLSCSKSLMRQNAMWNTATI